MKEVALKLETETLVEAAAGVNIQQRWYVAPPLVVTEESCEREGFDVKTFRQIVRRLKVPHHRTRAGITVVRADFERALRDHAEVVPVPSKEPSAPKSDIMAKLGARRPAAQQ